MFQIRVLCSCSHVFKRVGISGVNVTVSLGYNYFHALPRLSHSLNLQPFVYQPLRLRPLTSFATCTRPIGVAFTSLFFNERYFCKTFSRPQQGRTANTSRAPRLVVCESNELRNALNVSLRLLVTQISIHCWSHKNSETELGLNRFANRGLNACRVGNDVV